MAPKARHLAELSALPQCDERAVATSCEWHPACLSASRVRSRWVRLTQQLEEEVTMKKVPKVVAMFMSGALATSAMAQSAKPIRLGSPYPLQGAVPEGPGSVSGAPGLPAG